jgi:hypothetical protein
MRRARREGPDGERRPPVSGLLGKALPSKVAACGQGSYFDAMVTLAIVIHDVVSSRTIDRPTWRQIVVAHTVLSVSASLSQGFRVQSQQWTVQSRRAKFYTRTVHKGIVTVPQPQDLTSNPVSSTGLPKALSLKPGPQYRRA